jgi:hypothetical protein
MQALAIGGDLAMNFGDLPLRSSGSGRSMPWPGTRLDTPIRMVVVWIVRPDKALQMVRQWGLHLNSKLRHDAALYFVYQEAYAGKGPPRKHGDKVNYDQLPKQYLVATQADKQIETRIYQAQMLHHEFAQPLNVVILHKTNCKTGACAQVVLFSSDLALSYDKIIDFYRLRFQLEFNFRDAKQYWGLEDWMNVKEVPLTNELHPSLFMVNVSQVLLAAFRKTNP